MTDRKTEELDEADLAQVAGGRTVEIAVSNTLDYRRRKGTAGAGNVATGKLASGDITMKGKKINQN